MSSPAQFNGVVVDYGHGGVDEDGNYVMASKQYTFTDHDDYFCGEGIVNRKIAFFLINLLREAGVRVWDCVAGVECERNLISWDELCQDDVRLSKRVKYANKFPGALVVSIHSNAVGNNIRGPSLKPRGVSVYTSRGQTSSDPVATSLYEAFKKVLGANVRRGDWSDGDPDLEANFYMLKKTAGAAVLVEALFFTNFQDAMILNSTSGQQYIAKAYLAGIMPHIGPDQIAGDSISLTDIQTGHAIIDRMTRDEFNAFFASNGHLLTR
jgi:N-acetylmuramoyl-L-alanine amidase